MKILGIDPGTSRIGYGLIKDGSELKLIDCGVIEITEPDKKILILGKKYAKLLKKFQPDLVAIEKLFFAKNKKTALGVAQSRGVLILKSLEAKIPIAEYGPMEVKLATTGYGLSDKKAVATMVKIFLKADSLKGYDDASDALAIAIAASFHQKQNKI